VTAAPPEAKIGFDVDESGSPSARVKSEEFSDRSQAGVGAGA